MSPQKFGGVVVAGAEFAAVSASDGIVLMFFFLLWFSFFSVSLVGVAEKVSARGRDNEFIYTALFK